MASLSNPLTAPLIAQLTNDLGQDPFFGGGAGGGGFKLSEFFAITLLTGNETARNVQSNLDFADKGGFIWSKNRDLSAIYKMYDTERGILESISSDNAAEEDFSGDTLTSFNVDGFSLGVSQAVNRNGDDYAYWQWLKAQGFFDVVAYTGNGIAGNTVPIDLDDGEGSQFGFCMVKRLNGTDNWRCQHKDLGGSLHLELNGNQPAEASTDWNNTAATNTTLTLGATSRVNQVGGSLVVMAFAHNPPKGVFCGSYTGTGAPGNKVTTNFPVGLILIKKTDFTGDWRIYDNVRSPVNPATKYLEVNNAALEIDAASGAINFLSDGFELDGTSSGINNLGGEFVFMAMADPAQF